MQDIGREGDYQISLASETEILSTAELLRAYGFKFGWHNVTLRRDREPSDLYIGELSTDQRIKEESTRPALQAILRLAFRKFEIPTDGGVIDVGSGPSGEMGHHLLPVENRKVIHSDLSGPANQQNREKHPGTRIETASMLDLLSLGLPPQTILSGLSSFTVMGQNMARGFDQFAQMLRPPAEGEAPGHIVHLQLDQPGIGAVEMELLQQGRGPGIEVERLHVGHRPEKNVRIEGRVISIMEILRQCFERIVRKHPSLEMVYNDWIVAEKKPGGGMFMQSGLYLNTGLDFDYVSGLLTIAKRAA
ncbi:MAG: hypothetical protein Q8P95_01190 [bacterium]|nr:hypothetical protein [bacterium]